MNRNRSFYRVQSEEDEDEGCSSPRQKKRNRLKQFLVSSSTRFIKPTLSRKKTSRTNLSMSSSSVSSNTVERGNLGGNRGGGKGSAISAAAGDDEGGCLDQSSPLNSILPKFPPNDYYFLSRAVVNSNAKYLETAAKIHRITSYKRSFSQQGSYDLMYDTGDDERSDDDDEDAIPSLEEVSTTTENAAATMPKQEEEDDDGHYHDTSIMEEPVILMATPAERLSNSFISNVVHQEEERGPYPLRGDDDDDDNGGNGEGGNENNDPIVHRNDQSNYDAVQLIKGSWSHATHHNNDDDDVDDVDSGDNIIINLDPTLAAVASLSTSPSLDDDDGTDDVIVDDDEEDTVLLLKEYHEAGGESSSYRTGDRSSSFRTACSGDTSFHSVVANLPSTTLEETEDQNNSMYFSASNLPLSLSSDDVPPPTLPSPATTSDVVLLSSAKDNNENCGDDKWVNNNSESSGANLPRMLSMCSDNTSQSSNDEDSAAAILDTRNLPQNLLGSYNPSMSSDNDDDSAAFDDAVLMLYELDGELDDDSSAGGILALPSYPNREYDHRRYNPSPTSHEDEHDESTLMIQNYDPDADRQISEEQLDKTRRRFPPLSKICSCGKDDTLEEAAVEGNDESHSPQQQYLSYTDMTDTSSERSNRIIMPPSTMMSNYDMNRVAELDRWVAAENWQAIINASSSNLGKSNDDDECDHDDDHDDDRHKVDENDDEDDKTSRISSTREEDGSIASKCQEDEEVNDDNSANCRSIKEGEEEVKSSSFDNFRPINEEKEEEVKASSSLKISDDEKPPVEVKKATNSTSNLVLTHLNSSSNKVSSQPPTVDDEELIVDLDQWVEDGNWQAIIRASSSNLDKSNNDGRCDAAYRNRQDIINHDDIITSATRKDDIIISHCQEDVIATDVVNQLKTRDYDKDDEEEVKGTPFDRSDEEIPPLKVKKAMNSSSDKCLESHHYHDEEVPHSERATTNDDDNQNHHIDTAHDDEPSLVSNSLEIPLEDLITEKDPFRYNEESLCIPDERGLVKGEMQQQTHSPDKSYNGDSLIDVDSIFTMPVPTNNENCNKNDVVLAAYGDEVEEDFEQEPSVSTGNVTDLFSFESNIDVPIDYEEEQSQEQELRDQPVLSSPASSMFNGGIISKSTSTSSRSITPFHDIENYRPQPSSQQENRNDFPSSSSSRRISAIDVNHLDEFVNSCILVDEKHLVPKKKRSVAITTTTTTTTLTSSLHNDMMVSDDAAEMKRISTPFFVKDDNDDEQYAMREAIEYKEEKKKKKRRKFFGKSFLRRLVGKGPKFVSLRRGSSRHRVVVKTISASGMC